jgi:hypothetical protein
MYNVRTILIATALAFNATFAGAADDKHYKELGQCMAYTAIKNGFDGKNVVSPFAAQTLATLGDEFMFEASTLNISEQDAQTFVVHKLVEYNLQVEERGYDSLKNDLDTSCQGLVNTFKK